MKIEDPIKKISGNDGNLEKNGFLGTTGTWKNGFRETWEGVGNDQKKMYAPAKRFRLINECHTRTVFYSGLGFSHFLSGYQSLVFSYSRNS